MAAIAIIPTLNPSEKILEVVSGLITHGFSLIIIVNDGSKPEKQYIFDQLNQNQQVEIVTHNVNKGKGAALRTAFQYVLTNHPDFDGVITLDDDGQHKVEDVIACADALKKNKNSLIMGCRNFKAKETPFKNRLGNKITAFVFGIAYGVKISDTQTGLRAIPTQHLGIYINVHGDRFEYESNMLVEAKNNSISFVEVPIQTIYLEKNKASHFNPIVDSWRIYKQIFTFFFSSVLAFVVDITLFGVLSKTLQIESTLRLVFFATVGARIVSSLFNFLMNRYVVFKRKNSLGKALVRYYTLAVFQAMVSFGLVSLCAIFMAKDLLVVWKVIVDLCLFIISYRIQNRWVFQKKATAKMKKKSAIVTVIFDGLKLFGVTLLLILVLFFGSTTIVSYGPSSAARDLFVLTVMETSAAKFLARIYFSDEQIKTIIKLNSAHDTGEVSNGDDIVIPKDSDTFDLKAITVENITGATFIGKLMIVNDPSRLFVATLPEFSQTGRGKLLSTMVTENNAIAGINGGAFSDIGGVGRGGMPLGVVIQNGKIRLNVASEYSTLIGFDFNNHLVVGKMTAQEAIDKGVKEAVSFGPALIINGNRVPITGSGGGLNPRTAIGQRADGAVLLLVIAGRQATSLGASYADIADIMVEHGAVNAANLDGGGSTLLIYNGEMMNPVALVNGPREIPTAFLVRK